MRVTANTFPDSLLVQLRGLSQRQNQLQSQAASGQRVSQPEDDPVAMRRALDLQAENAAQTQYQRNIGVHQEMAGATFAALKSLKNISDRAREIATAADNLRSPEELRIYAKEVTQLIEHAVDLANTRNRGDYIFAGTRSDQAAFVLAADANGVVTGVTYQGNISLAESEIAEGVAVSTQIPGANTSGAGPRGLITDDRVGADLFQHLIDLQTHLLSGDTAAIETVDRAALGKDEENLLYHVGSNGAIQARLESTNRATGQRLDTIEQLVSKEVDADLTETIVRLTQTQTAYQAALQSAGRILGSSLLDYLR